MLQFSIQAVSQLTNTEDEHKSNFKHILAEKIKWPQIDMFYTFFPISHHIYEKIHSVQMLKILF